MWVNIPWVKICHEAISIFSTKLEHEPLKPKIEDRSDLTCLMQSHGSVEYDWRPQRMHVSMESISPYNGNSWLIRFHEASSNALKWFGLKDALESRRPILTRVIQPGEAVFSCLSHGMKLQNVISLRIQNLP